MLKTTLITGAGSGFGKGAAIGMAKNGHNIIGTVHVASQVTPLREEAKALGLENFRSCRGQRSGGKRVVHRHRRWIVPFQAAVEAANSSTVPQFMRCQVRHARARAQGHGART